MTKSVRALIDEERASAPASSSRPEAHRAWNSSLMCRVVVPRFRVKLPPEPAREGSILFPASSFQLPASLAELPLHYRGPGFQLPGSRFRPTPNFGKCTGDGHETVFSSVNPVSSFLCATPVTSHVPFHSNPVSSFQLQLPADSTPQYRKMESVNWKWKVLATARNSIS